jgi:hypothetical protein
MISVLIGITFASIAQLRDATNHDSTQLTVSAVPICAAKHASCSGSARMFIVNDYEPIELDRCNVRAGETFELSTSKTRVPWLHCVIRVELSLEGHELATLDFPNGCEARFELGPWRMGVHDDASPSSSDRPTHGGGPGQGADGFVRIVLTGGDPIDGIARISGPARDLHGSCAQLKLSDPGVRRLDARQWEIDVDQLESDFREALKLGYVIPHTTSGGALLEHEDPGDSSNLVKTFAFAAPSRLCKMIGHVVDASGAPVVGACVTGYGIGYERGPTAVSSDGGRFEFNNLRCGQCWFFVSDDRWGSRKLRNEQADLSSGSRDDLVIVVDPLRQFELDARHVEFGDARFVVMIIEGRGYAPCPGTRVFARGDLSRVLTMPASWWSSSFAIKLVAVPRDGLQLQGDVERWTHEVSGWRTLPRIPDPWIAGSSARATLSSD